MSKLLLENGSYGDDEFELAKSFTSPEGNVLVVGANIGAHAVPLSRCCKKLHAIEANPAVFAHLVSNLRLNDCGNSAAYSVAASNKHETIRFLMTKENAGGSKRYPIKAKYEYFYDNPDEIEVQAEKLDDVIAERNFDLVFMDIEGSEYFALGGMQDILKGTKAISIEYYPCHITEVAGVTLEEWYSTLEPHFDWLYVSSAQDNAEGVYPKDQIFGVLKAMFDAGKFHEGVYFLKNPLPTWLQEKVKSAA